MRQTVERLLSKKQVREIVGLSYAQMARMEEAEPPKFPRRVRLTDIVRGRCRYPESEIAARSPVLLLAEDLSRGSSR